MVMGRRCWGIREGDEGKTFWGRGKSEGNAVILLFKRPLFLFVSFIYTL